MSIANPDTRPRPLLITCPHCEDRMRWASKYGGNDPDVWPTGPCETCDGTGEVVVSCECCRGEASEVVDDVMLCRDCAEEQRHEAAMEMIDAQ